MKSKKIITREQINKVFKALRDGNMLRSTTIMLNSLPDAPVGVNEEYLCTVLLRNTLIAMDCMEELPGIGQVMLCGNPVKEVIVEQVTTGSYKPGDHRTATIHVSSNP